MVLVAIFNLATYSVAAFCSSTSVMNPPREILAMFITGTFLRMVRIVNNPCVRLSSGTSVMPALNGFVRRRFELLTFENYFSLVGVSAVNGARQFGFTSTHQSVEPGDFPGTVSEGDII